MKTRVASLGSPTASEQDGLVRGLMAAACGWFLAARITRKFVELCFLAFFEGDGAIRPLHC